MDVMALIEKTVTGLGYEFVDFERAGRGLLRVFIDQSGGVGVEDCVAVSNQLTRLMAVEGVDYQRLEVSSPGLDRPLRRREDFARFVGKEIKLRVRLPRAGRRNYVGRILSVSDSALQLVGEGEEFLTVEWSDIDRANLVPEF